MKKFIAILFLFTTSAVTGQDNIFTKYKLADSLLLAENPNQAYPLLKEIEAKCNTKDTLYPYVLWYYNRAATLLEQNFRMKERFDSSLFYGQEALKLIKKGVKYFKGGFGDREYWMTKNIIVSYFGLAQLNKAKKYRDILYKAYDKNALPDGIDHYFNFDFFRMDSLNIWGYEWFEKLPKDRMSKSFTKIVYYVYSTNPDGSDNKQLCRYHVLMFHKTDNSVKFDYVLTRIIDTDTYEIDGTYYSYMYYENIDYLKLKKDIREIITKKIEPDLKSMFQKKTD